MYIHEREFNIALARKGLAAIAVARELGVHHTTLSRWVRGWYPVPKKYQSQIAEILEVHVDELFGERSNGGYGE